MAEQVGGAGGLGACGAVHWARGETIFLSPPFCGMATSGTLNSWHGARGGVSACMQTLPAVEGVVPELNCTQPDRSQLKAVSCILEHPRGRPELFRYEPSTRAPETGGGRLFRT